MPGRRESLKVLSAVLLSVSDSSSSDELLEKDEDDNNVAPFADDLVPC